MRYKFDELKWIDFLKKKVPIGKDVLTGIGDDCALVSINKQKFLLKSDLFIEGVHFDLRKTSYETIGMRAAGRVLSDFASCGGVPKFLGVSAGVSNKIDEKNLKNVLRGILRLGEQYHFNLIGGDTSCSSKFFLDIWGVGVCDRFIARNTAQNGDYIFLTGKLGVHAFNKQFIPRIKEARYLVDNFKINSMIDISDGFVLDLYRILKASKKGALLYKKDIPFVHINDLYRGEDYELIFTVNKAEKNIKLLKSKFYLIGIIKGESFGYKMKDKNKFNDIKLKGYTHRII